MLRIALLVALALFSSYSVSAQQGDPIPDQLRKQFESLVGKWHMTGTVAEGQARATMTMRWAPGKHAILFNSNWSDPDSRSLGSGVFGWDGSERKVHMSEFWDDGYYHHRHFDIKSDTLWEGEQFAGATPDGEQIRGTIRMEFHGPDEWTFNATSWTHGGQEQEKPKLTFKRAKNTATKEEFAEFLQAMNGQWTGEITILQDIPGVANKGDQLKVSGEHVLTDDGNAITSSFRDEQGATSSSLTFFDPSTRQIREQTVFSSGTAIISYYVKNGDKWQVFSVTTDSEGNRASGTDELTISNNGNTHTWKRGGQANVWHRNQ
ncbi:hypothetical protein [Novipirellula artificiosorum]|uniref:DUF1579 domain-containing protein n=1 Tax=Novipirellula artificiosorum TaxID=2528016 RepID=A0A5C6DRP2_9BACT|nr:hypothetical protein [Novipirellula artificiosorum]TWU39332.1 hypothetical protein Poly41_21560 [Novipirellula artificiosorum]